MSGWNCPHCQTYFKDGDYPDHWRDGRSFLFECEHCASSFIVDVDWSPQFYVLKSTLKIPHPPKEMNR